MTEPASPSTRGGGRTAERPSLPSTGTVAILPDDLRTHLRAVGAGATPALPYAELVSSLDTTVDAVDLLHRCALVEGGGESVHLLSEASQGLHRAAYALRELAAAASSTGSRPAGAAPTRVLANWTPAWEPGSARRPGEMSEERDATAPSCHPHTGRAGGDQPALSRTGAAERACDELPGPRQPPPAGGPGAGG